MEYFMMTGAYPMALFQGMALAGGGSNESMYEYYREAYESVLDFKTPLSFNMEIEKVSSTKYMVNIESKVVGICNDLGLKLQVVLTENNIDYLWANETIELVNFVARGMFPDFQGTMLNYVGDSLAKASIEIEVDPFVNKSNYKVVAFIQHPQYYSIQNGDIKSLPILKNVIFTVNGFDNLPLEGAQIKINNETKNTDELGQAVFGIFDNAGELEFTISMQNYDNYNGLINMDTAENVTVFMAPNSIADSKINKTKIFPNPSKESITIQTEVNSNIIFYRISGKAILNIGNVIGTKQYDISELNNGIYIIKVYSGDSIKSIRFLKH
ncbi:MAG: T9SS type A sorting domain-containing protein [Salinivirgaceae bacterium]|nr:T9SS type A sorting domain-containing protein [Salinivirgaceae bacterium]